MRAFSVLLSSVVGGRRHAVLSLNPCPRVWLLLICLTRAAAATAAAVQTLRASLTRAPSLSSLTLLCPLCTPPLFLVVSFFPFAFFPPHHSYPSLTEQGSECPGNSAAAATTASVVGRIMRKNIPSISPRTSRMHAYALLLPQSEHVCVTACVCATTGVDRITG